MNESGYDSAYAQEAYYWGKEPSKMCDWVLERIDPRSDGPRTLIDLGCGEGRNAVHFARQGFEVTGMDLSLPGLEKTRRYAEEAGVQVRTVQANIVSYELDRSYDVIFSTGTLHYLPPEVRQQRFADYKAHTSAGGINVLGVFVEKPFIPPAPDSEPTDHSYQSGELLTYYWDWEILHFLEEIFDCTSSGVPHRHAVNRIVARRWMA